MSPFGPGKLGLLFTAAPIVMSASAMGQIVAVAPYFAVVEKDDAMMRCGGDDMLYPIAKLAKGQMLRVDGEGGGWSRVGYPANTPAFITSDSIQPDTGGKTGTVTKPTKLKAFNLTTGLKGSWNSVFEQPVAVGTKLVILDAEPTPDGRGNSAFKVVPPETARGFVQTGALRKATSDEINQYMAQAAPKPADGKSATPPKQGEPAPGTVAAKPDPAAAPTGQPATTVKLADPIVPPKPQAATPNAPATNTPAGPAAPGAQPEAPVAANPATNVEIKPAPVIPPSPYERLESAFEAVRKQPADTAEFSELMAEYQAAIEKLDDSPASKNLRPRLQQRLDYLKLRADIQAQQRAISGQQAVLTQDDELLKKRLEEVDRVRQYAIVGRLSASTIYDGKRLPLMYRVQTVGGPAPRTLAYIKPDPKLAIDAKLGQVVGVIGESVVDATLKIKIVTPLRVDTLEPMATPGASQPDGAAKPAADATEGAR